MAVLMKFAIMEYFANEVSPRTASIQPNVIDNNDFTVEGSMNNYCNSLVTNDGAYLIRYGGIGTNDGYNSIQVFTAQSLENQQPLYSFNNLKINNHSFVLIDLHQDEDGRFYGIARYMPDSFTSEYYLVILNNFIQDGTCKVNKFYKDTTMGTTNELFKVTKNNGEYYMLSTNQVYCYKIDIVEGNALTTYPLGSTIQPSQLNDNIDIFVLENDLIVMQVVLSNGVLTCQKAIINLNKDLQNSYSMQTVYQDSQKAYTNFPVIINHVYKMAYSTSNGSGGYKFNYLTIDLNGNVTDKSYNLRDFTSFYARFAENYIAIFEPYTENLSIIWDQGARFKDLYFESISYNPFLNLNIIQQFNLVYLVGQSSSSVSYIKMIYSAGYSSSPNSYYSINTQIPQYLNLYLNSDEKSVFYSRNVSNRFLAGNQLTTTFFIPYNLLNNQTIAQESLYGQTNVALIDLEKEYSKNRFENLYFNFLLNVNIIDNTNGDNLINSIGSNRIANSMWNLLDYQESPCTKARITYNDETQEIVLLTLESEGIFSRTYEFTVTGDVVKIEYISNDEKTVYATYRCSLTGTNTISQTIRIQGG